jgi:hypothetical protein
MFFLLRIAATPKSIFNAIGEVSSIAHLFLCIFPAEVISTILCAD